MIPASLRDRRVQHPSPVSLLPNGTGGVASRPVRAAEPGITLYPVKEGCSGVASVARARDREEAASMPYLYLPSHVVSRGTLTRLEGVRVVTSLI